MEELQPFLATEKGSEGQELRNTTQVNIKHPENDGDYAGVKRAALKYTPTRNINYYW